jgi:hypothetical protein
MQKKTDYFDYRTWHSSRKSGILPEIGLLTIHWSQIWMFCTLAEYLLFIGDGVHSTAQTDMAGMRAENAH